MTDGTSPPGGRVLTEFSNAMVALHREHFGRGAGAAKSFIFDDLALCILSDVYTPVEKTLIKAGQHEHVRHTRMLHQLALEEAYRLPVEELLGRKVRAVISSVHFDPDVAVELFMLEPQQEEPV
jgi:uncharacterized protein YbcI